MHPILFETRSGSPSTPTALLLAAAYLLGLQLALVRARGARPGRQPRHGPRHLDHHQRAGRRQAAAAHRRLATSSRSDPRELLVAGALGRRVLRRPDRSRSSSPCWYLRRHKLPLWTTTDVFAPGIALGHVIGRLGCLLAGCCFGRPTDGAVGHHVHAIRSRPPTSARRSACRCIRRSSTKRAPKLLILVGLLLVIEKQRPPVPRPHVLELHAALRRVALHHRVLPRRSAAGSTSAMLSTVAVHLARSSSPLSHRDARAWLVAGGRRRAPHARARPRHGLDVGSESTATARGHRPSTTALRLDALPGARVLPDQSRSQMQRLIKDGQRPRSRGAGAQGQARRCEAGADVHRRAAGAGAADAARRRRCRSTSSTKTPTSSSSTSPPAWSSIPAAGHASGTLVNALLHHVDDLSGIGGELRPGHRPPARPRHVRPDGRRQERRGAPGAVAAVPRPRSREGIHRAGLGRACTAGTPHRRADRARSEQPAEDVDPRPARAQRRDARSRGREHVPGRVAAAASASPPGRTHQIRVHLSAHRPPDRRRRAVRRRPPPRAAAAARRAALDRPFLHASRLSFDHPGDGRRLEFRSELPASLAEVVERLRHDAEHLRY